MPRAARSDPAPPAPVARAEVWRAVESQHVISTMRLVDNLPADQRLLEDILEQGKPPVPENARHLHWLLATPFRYAPRIGGSRFRAREQPGVYYAARALRSACAEAGFWKWRFVRDSAGLSKLDAHPMTLFPADLRGRTWNLTRPPFSARGTEWTDPVDYAATQALAAKAREAAVQVIEFESVRDPEHGRCAAVLDPRALIGPPDPMLRAQSWFLTVSEHAVVWQRDANALFQFDFRGFESRAALA